MRADVEDYRGTRRGRFRELLVRRNPLTALVTGRDGTTVGAARALRDVRSTRWQWSGSTRSNWPT